MNQFYNDVFFPYLLQNKIKKIIHLGDLVDKRKSISYLSLKNMQDNFINVIGENAIETHIIVGNHDCYFRNTNSVNSVKELYQRNPHIRVYEWPETVSFDGFEICMIPWITNENQQESLHEIENTNARVLMGHLEVNGFTMHGNIVCEHGYSKNLFKKFEYVFSGHFHVKNGDGHIQYLGTPYEMMWSDCGNTKGFHIFDTETLELEFVKNPNRLFHKLYYDDTDIENPEQFAENFSQYENCYVKVIVSEKNNPFFFEKYIEKLDRSNPANITIIDSNPDWDSYEDEKVDETEDTLTILEKYVNNMEIDIDKYHLNSILKEIYTEATEIR